MCHRIFLQSPCSRSPSSPECQSFEYSEPELCLDVVCAFTLAVLAAGLTRRSEPRNPRRTEGSPLSAEYCDCDVEPARDGGTCPPVDVGDVDTCCDSVDERGGAFFARGMITGLPDEGNTDFCSGDLVQMSGLCEGRGEEKDAGSGRRPSNRGRGGCRHRRCIDGPRERLVCVA
ncbi:hypothetical protein F5148DRAFT_592549 [Russula earlei]|uniref:Uncharacterized protein n=1 Tax=Russula earlei TaxID=71964 RepID=A0ACC0UF82_9AGAM|nr:hypothetical protein F5148DRAFT_592549 [Russula earlei]